MRCDAQQTIQQSYANERINECASKWRKAKQIIIKREEKKNPGRIPQCEFAVRVSHWTYFVCDKNLVLFSFLVAMNQMQVSKLDDTHFLIITQSWVAIRSRARGRRMRPNNPHTRPLKQHIDSIIMSIFMFLCQLCLFSDRIPFDFDAFAIWQIDRFALRRARHLSCARAHAYWITCIAQIISSSNIYRLDFCCCCWFLSTGISPFSILFSFHDL